MNVIEQFVWRTLDQMQGDVAAEIRVMLGEGPLSKDLFTEEQKQRRIVAMVKCAAESTSDTDRHDAWMKMHEEGGWKYGTTFDPVNKIHPNLLPWNQLPDTVKSKARIFNIVAKTGVALLAGFDPSSTPRLTTECPQSSNIASCSWDGTSTLFVKFKGGDTWQYAGVSREEYTDLILSESIGSHFNCNIKNKYPGKKVE